MQPLYAVKNINNNKKKNNRMTFPQANAQKKNKRSDSDSNKQIWRLI